MGFNKSLVSFTNIYLEFLYFRLNISVVFHEISPTPYIER